MPEERRGCSQVCRQLSPTSSNPALMYSSSTVAYSEFKRLISVTGANKNSLYKIS